ncbi:hypothetical protein N9D02_09250 [Emcibacteraceae bacterium]|nr:hypothetical protein [Emcibacteraceae bacterium]
MTYNKENPGAARTASGEYIINKLGMFTCNHDTSSTSETQDKSSPISAVIEEWISSKVEVV